MLSNCGAGEDSWESPGLQGDPTSQSYRKSTVKIHWKDWCWSCNTLATWCKSKTDSVKDPDAGKDWRWEEKGTTEDEMVGRHLQLNGQEFEQTPGDSEGQGSLSCCSSWGRRVRINWVTEQEQQCIVTRPQIRRVDKTLRGMGEHRKKQPLWAGGSRKISQRTGELVGTPRGEEGLSGWHELCGAENQATCQSVSIQGSFWRRNTF